MALPSDGQESRTADEPRFPRAIRLAGVLSIISACVLLLQAALTLLMAIDFASAGPEGAICAVPLSLITGVACLIFSIRITWGKAEDTLSHGILSVLCGLLNCIFGAIFLRALHEGAPYDLFLSPPQTRTRAVFVGSVNILAGVGLLAAGGLALTGYEKYRTWRRPRDWSANKGANDVRHNES